MSASVDLAPRDRLAIRALLDAAFAGDFSDDDWEHSVGGTHVILDSEHGVVAHAAVVPRVLTIGESYLRVGYIEAVAVLPARQRTGLGTTVMRAVAEVIARDFALGLLSTGEWHFYERLGWERWRGPTWVRHADGRLERSEADDDSLMVLRTHASPPVDVSTPITCAARRGDAW